MIDSGIILVLVIITGLWYWWDSRGTAEIALNAVQQRCQQYGVTLLHGAVVWQSVRLQRHQTGKVQLKRTYTFEFTPDLQQPYQGKIILLGRQVLAIDTAAYRIE